MVKMEKLCNLTTAMVLAAALAIGCGGGEKEAKKDEAKTEQQGTATPEQQAQGGGADEENLFARLAFNEQADVQACGRNQDVKFDVKNATFLSEGKEGGAYQFDATKQAYMVREAATATPLGAFTIAMWVKVDPTLAVDQTLYAETSGQSHVPLFQLVAANQGGGKTGFRVFMRDSAERELLNRASQTLVEGTDWVHVAFATNNGKATLYINGEPDQAAFDYTPSELGVNRTALGALVRGDVINHLNGAIDDLRIYKGALTQDEVKQAMGAAK